MGNTHAVDFEYKISVNDYKPIQKIKDTRLGELIQMKDLKTGELVMMREKYLPDSDTYRKVVEDYVNHLTLSHPHLGRVYGFAGADSQEKFIHRCKIYVYFEYLPSTLQATISAKRGSVLNNGERSKNRADYFTEPRLFKIMAQLVDVLEYLQQNSITHGEIKPDTCFMSNEGAVKILNRKLIYDENSAFKMAKQGDQSVFLTPKAFECIKKRVNEPMEDKYKADVFSLGLTLLECATLKPSSQIFDWNNFRINLHLLSNRLLEVKGRYSPDFYNVLREMVQLEEDYRPDFSILKNYLVEGGWINPTQYSTGNLTDMDTSDLYPRIEVHSTNTIQTKSLKDKQQAINVRPKRPSLSIRGVKKSSISTNIHLSPTQPTKNHPALMQEAQYDEYGEENIEPSNRLYHANKVPGPAVSRSAAFSRSPENRNWESPFEKLQQTAFREIQMNIHQEVLLNDRIHQTLHNTNKKFNATVGHSQSKAIFSEIPKVDRVLTSPDASFRDCRRSDYRTIQDFGYHYNYGNTPFKSNFSVENLLHETVQRSEKNPNLVSAALSQPPQAQVDITPAEGDCSVMTDSNLSNIEFAQHFITPKNLANVFFNTKNSSNQNSIYNNAQHIMPNDIPDPMLPDLFSPNFPEPGFCQEGDLDVYNGLSIALNSSGFKQDALNSSQNTSRELESARPSFKPKVVEYGDNAMQVDRYLIDSIVKPEKYMSRFQGEIPPFLSPKNQTNFDLQLLHQEEENNIVVFEASQTTQEEVVVYEAPQTDNNLKDLLKAVKIDFKDEKTELDTSLGKDIDLKMGGDGFMFTQNLSTKCEDVHQDDHRNKLPQDNIPEYSFDEKINKALERSRRTYEFAKMNGFTLDSYGGLTDLLGSTNYINNGNQ